MPCSPAQFVERADSPDPSVRKQCEPIAHLFGISELMDRKKERASARRDAPQHTHHVPGLPQIEAVEWLVHQQNGVAREKSERDNQAAIVAFGQGMNALRQDRPETDG